MPGLDIYYSRLLGQLRNSQDLTDAFKAELSLPVVFNLPRFTYNNDVERTTIIDNAQNELSSIFPNETFVIGDVNNNQIQGMLNEILRASQEVISGLEVEVSRPLLEQIRNGSTFTRLVMDDNFRMFLGDIGAVLNDNIERDSESSFKSIRMSLPKMELGIDLKVLSSSASPIIVKGLTEQLEGHIAKLEAELEGRLWEEKVMETVPATEVTAEADNSFVPPVSFVPENVMTEEVQKEAVEADNSFVPPVPFVPENVMTEEVQKAAAEYNIPDEPTPDEPTKEENFTAPVETAEEQADITDNTAFSPIDNILNGNDEEIDDRFAEEEMTEGEPSVENVTPSTPEEETPETPDTPSEDKEEKTEPTKEEMKKVEEVTSKFTNNVGVGLNDAPTPKADPVAEPSVKEEPKKDIPTPTPEVNDIPKTEVVEARTMSDEDVIKMLSGFSRDAVLEEAYTNPAALRWLKQSFSTCMDAVSHNGLCLEYINKPNYFIERAACRQNGLAIQFVKHQVNSLQIDAIKQNPSAVYCIKKPTPTALLLAINLNYDAKRFNQTPGLSASDKLPYDPNLVQGICSKYRSCLNQHICNVLVEHDPNNLRYIPSEFKTQRLCYKATNKDSHTVQFVPPKKQTDKMLNAVIEDDPKNIGLVANPKFDLCAKAMEYDRNTFSLLPERVKAQFIKDFNLEAYSNDNKGNDSKANEPRNNGEDR